MRKYHCELGIFNEYGRCIASCSKRDPITGEDCIGKKSEDEPLKIGYQPEYGAGGHRIETI